jgi:hypothetical protein
MQPSDVGRGRFYYEPEFIDPTQKSNRPLIGGNGKDSWPSQTDVWSGANQTVWFKGTSYHCHHQ